MDGICFIVYSNNVTLNRNEASVARVHMFFSVSNKSYRRSGMDQSHRNNEKSSHYAKFSEYIGLVLRILSNGTISFAGPLCTPMSTSSEVYMIAKAAKCHLCMF